MLKSIYIGNLDWKTTLDELKDFFSPYGQITSAEIKKDRETGMARGFGFVTMENADKAILELNGKELRGRTVKINEARERERQEYNPRQEDKKEVFPPAEKMTSLRRGLPPGVPHRHSQDRREEPPRGYREEPQRNPRPYPSLPSRREEPRREVYREEPQRNPRPYPSLPSRREEPRQEVYRGTPRDPYYREAKYENQNFPRRYDYDRPPVQPEYRAPVRNYQSAYEPRESSTPRREDGYQPLKRREY